jgi:MarR family transcriptional regulator, temperature-dependent positive regulator of motility
MFEINEMAGYMIRRLHQISVAVFSERMAREGYELTPVQFGALSALEADPGIDQATLASAIAYDRATIGGVVDRLEQKGLIERTVSEKDRRARTLRLTPAGRKLLDEVRPHVLQLQSDILAGLDPAETGQLLALLRKATDSGNPPSRAQPRSNDDKAKPQAR